LHDVNIFPRATRLLTFLHLSSLYKIADLMTLTFDL